MIQTVANNYLGYKSVVNMAYDFAGNVTKSREAHGFSATGTDVLETVNTYDDRGRLLSTTTKLNNGLPATTTCTYDAVGRLVGQKYGNLQETLAYNTRGWLTSKESAPFKMKLRYESPQQGKDSCFNGNISEWEWQQGTNTAMMYGFKYDGVNRLKGSTHYQRSGNTWSLLAGNSAFDEKGLTYDKNGNILTLTRTGSTPGTQSYAYTGNQLKSVTKGGVVGTYMHDKNGNMINDSRKALNLSYNVLNLLSEVKTTAGILKAKYLYLADGRKLRVRDNGEVNGFDYTGSLTYRKSSAGLQLEAANFGSGVIRVIGSTGNQQEVNYVLTDHLGSVRLIVDGNGVVKERNDYYPFGARHARSDYAQRDGNRLKYNGKEEQVTGDLDFLDYGARMYDSGLGRWFMVDPLSEKYYALSLFQYCANNPIIYVDIKGEKIVIVHNKNTDQVYNDLAKIYATPLGRQMINELHNSSEVFTIGGKSGLSFYKAKSNKLRYNPKIGEVDGVPISSYEVLGHELRHAYQDLQGIVFNSTLGELEKDAIMMENYLRLIYGDKNELRTLYSGKQIFDIGEKISFNTFGLRLKESDVRYSTVHWTTDKYGETSETFKRDNTFILANFVFKVFEFMNGAGIERVYIKF